MWIFYKDFFFFFFFFLLPSTPIWGVCSETFIRLYNRPSLQALSVSSVNIYATDILYCFKLFSAEWQAWGLRWDPFIVLVECLVDTLWLQTTRSRLENKTTKTETLLTRIRCGAEHRWLIEFIKRLPKNWEREAWGGGGGGGRERNRDRDRDRQRETETERQRETETERDRDRERTETERDRDSVCVYVRERGGRACVCVWEREREGGGCMYECERGREREIVCVWETDRQTDRQTDRLTDRQTDSS